MNSFRMFTRLCSNAAVNQPEPKQSLRKRLGTYIKMVLTDYKMVAEETVQDIKDYPIKASIYFSLLGSVGYLLKTNPSEESFRVKIIDNANELMMVGDPIRNPISEQHVQNIIWGLNKGEIKRLNLGVCSLMWQDRFGSHVDVFAAQCKPLKIGWLEMKDYIVDIGIAGRWLWTDKAMIDYDINPTEWPEEEKKT